MFGRRSPRIVHGDLYRRLVRARDFMAAHHSEPLTLAAIARQAGLSPYHFLRLHKQAFATTPHQHLTELRLERAKAMLARGEASVTEVCLEVGYSSLGSFSTLFARHVGRSPARFQREVRRVVQVPARLPALYIPGCFLYMFAGEAAAPPISGAPPR
jgi:AraC-like DNA-binding protein